MKVDWLLEGILTPGKNWLIPIATFPFVIGRDESCDLCLASPDVSRIHARFTEQDETLMLEDLGSKNGTFVNGVQVTGSRVLHHGDIVHFPTVEFRIGGPPARNENPSVEENSFEETGIWTNQGLPHNFAQEEHIFRSPLTMQGRTDCFRAHHQPSYRRNHRAGGSWPGRLSRPCQPSRPTFYSCCQPWYGSQTQ